MFGVTFNPGAIFNSNPIKQVINTVRKFPIKSLMGSMVGLSVSAMLNIPLLLSAPLAVLSVAHLTAFVYEYKRLFFPIKHYEPTLQAQEIFDNNNNKIAELSFIKNKLDSEKNDNSFKFWPAKHKQSNSKGIPYLDIQTEKPHLMGQAIAKATHKQFLEVLDRYFSLMLLKIRYTHWRTPHEQDDYIEYINQEVKRLNYSYPKRTVAILEGFVEEINKSIRKHNQQYMFGWPTLTVDNLKSLIAILDVMKTNEAACTAAINDNRLIRGLDFPGLGMLNSLVFSMPNPSKNPDKNKPSKVLSIGFVPSIMHTNCANENLVIVLNEIGTTSTMRRNPGGTPKFLFLFDKLIRKCRTIDEVKAILDDQLAHHKPAASHTLTVWEVDTGKGCIFQMLPPGLDDVYLARETVAANETVLGVTNHHFDKDHMPLVQSMTKENSFFRYAKLQQGASLQYDDKKLLDHVSQPSTLQQMIFSKRDGELFCDLRCGCSKPVLEHSDYVEFSVSNKLSV